MPTPAAPNPQCHAALGFSPQPSSTGSEPGILGQKTGHQRAEKSAQIDPHVKDRKARIAAGVARRVELADDDADIRFEEPCAQDDEPETEIKRRGPWRGQRVVPQRDQDAAVQHRFALANDAVGDPSARYAHQIHERRVGPVDGGRCRDIEAHPAGGDAGRHVEDEERPHTVVAEAFPHFGQQFSGFETLRRHAPATPRLGRPR